MILLIISMLVLLIPAYLLTGIFLKRDLIMSLAVSIGFAIALSVFSGFLLNLYKITAATVWAFYIALTLILAIIIFIRKIPIFPHAELTKKQLMILLALLISASVLISIPRLDYRFPNHLDEWTHLSYADTAIETGHLFKSPFGNYTEFHLEAGNHVFIAEAFLLTGADIFLDFKYLPVIFIFLTSFILFATVYSLTKKYWVAVLSVIFLLTLQSSANILGIWLFTPFSMSFPLIFLFLYLFSEGIREDKIDSMIISILFLLMTLFIHPSTAIMLGTVAFIYALLNFHYIKKHYLILSASSAILIVAGIILSKTMFKQNITNTVSMVLSYKFPLGVSYTYNYFILYGIMPSLFALLGLWIAVKSKTFKIYSVFWLAMFAYYLLSYFLPYTLYIEYHRIVYLLLLSSLFLSALGVYFVMKHIKQPYLKYGAIAIMLLLLILFSFNQYYTKTANDPRDIRAHWHRYITENDYQDLLWLKNSEIKGKKIFSMPEIGAVIPLTGNYPSSRMMMLHGFESETLDGYKFFTNTTCSVKNQLLNKYKSDYVLSRFPINCSFLELEHKGREYLYSVTKKKTNHSISTSDFYSIHELKQKNISEGSYNTEGYVVKIYTCPQCPTNAMCKPCMRNNIVISEDNLTLEAYSLTENDLIIFTSNSNPKQFELGKRYTFSINITKYKSTSEPINDIELVGYDIIQ